VKGVCPNPGGRTKSAEISKALRVKLKSEVSLPRVGRTYAEQLVDEWVSLGLGGNAAAIAGIADRAEGRPSVSIGFDQSENPLIELVAAMHLRSKQIGPPEGSMIRREANNDESEGPETAE